MYETITGKCSKQSGIYKYTQYLQTHVTHDNSGLREDSYWNSIPNFVPGYLFNLYDLLAKQL